MLAVTRRSSWDDAPTSHPTRRSFSGLRCTSRGRHSVGTQRLEAGTRGHGVPAADGLDSGVRAVRNAFMGSTQDTVGFPGRCVDALGSHGTQPVAITLIVALNAAVICRATRLSSIDLLPPGRSDKYRNVGARRGDAGAGLSEHQCVARRSVAATDFTSSLLTTYEAIESAGDERVVLGQRQWIPELMLHR